VTAKDGLVKVALLDVGGEAGARTAALDIDDDERDLCHGSPADGLGFERDSGAGAACDGQVAGIGKPEGHRNGAQLILALHEEAAVFGELRAQGLHDGGPWRDGIRSAIAHTGGDQPISEGLVAIHRNLARPLAGRPGSN